MSKRGEFEAWWDRHGQFVRAGGGDYEKCFAYAAWNFRATPQQAVPEGWTLVPVEPTESMRLAPAKDRPGFSRNVAAEIYRSMLAAAPQPSQEQPARQKYQD